MVEKDILAVLEQALKNAPRIGFPKGGCVMLPDDIPDDILPPPPEEIWLAEQFIEAREAEKLAYEAACGNYYDAQQRHFEARIAWGTEYAEEHYPVPDLPTPPCDGSYTDPWESTEAIHGKLFATLEDAADHHCGQPVGLGCGDYFAA